MARYAAGGRRPSLTGRGEWPPISGLRCAGGRSPRQSATTQPRPPITVNTPGSPISARCRRSPPRARPRRAGPALGVCLPAPRGRPVRSPARAPRPRRRTLERGVRRLEPRHSPGFWAHRKPRALDRSRPAQTQAQRDARERPEGGGFGSPMLVRRRSWAQRFTRPGTYRIFCTPPAHDDPDRPSAGALSHSTRRPPPPRHASSSSGHQGHARRGTASALPATPDSAPRCGSVRASRQKNQQEQRRLAALLAAAFPTGRSPSCGTCASRWQCVATTATPSTAT